MDMETRVMCCLTDVSFLHDKYTKSTRVPSGYWHGSLLFQCDFMGYRNIRTWGAFGVKYTSGIRLRAGNRTDASRRV
jgi:hypothetical protein